MPRLHLFEGFGVELEYMVVDAVSLDVRPAVPAVLRELAGEERSDVQIGQITWSNELTAHVIELKTTEPAGQLSQLVERFDRAIDELQSNLQALGFRLLPTAMHPWMDPRHETRLWPGECAEIYQAYDRIFDCHRHGWANVQSTHLNLPFANDEEFARLHAACRLVLPLLPGLAASSPIADGVRTDWLDARLEHYVHHCDRVPSLIGDVIPEPVFDEQAYRTEILTPIGRDIRPLDADRVLQLEFLNARGCIARFDRGAIEIRLLDVQETPAADLAICWAVSEVLQLLVRQTWTSLDEQKALMTSLLRQLLNRTIRDADAAVIDVPDFLRQFGIRARSMTCGQLWDHLLGQLTAHSHTPSEFIEPLRHIRDAGPLARRILGALAEDAGRARLMQTYRQLSDAVGRSIWTGRTADGANP